MIFSTPDVGAVKVAMRDVAVVSKQDPVLRPPNVCNRPPGPEPQYLPCSWLRGPACLKGGNGGTPMVGYPTDLLCGPSYGASPIVMAFNLTAFTLEFMGQTGLDGSGSQAWLTVSGPGYGQFLDLGLMCSGHVAVRGYLGDGYGGYAECGGVGPAFYGARHVCLQWDGSTLAVYLDGHPFAAHWGGRSELEFSPEGVNTWRLDLVTGFDCTRAAIMTEVALTPSVVYPLAGFDAPVRVDPTAEQIVYLPCDELDGVAIKDAVGGGSVYWPGGYSFRGGAFLPILDFDARVAGLATGGVEGPGPM